MILGNTFFFLVKNTLVTSIVLPDSEKKYIKIRANQESCEEFRKKRTLSKKNPEIEHKKKPVIRLA